MPSFYLIRASIRCALNNYLLMNTGWLGFVKLHLMTLIKRLELPKMVVFTHFFELNADKLICLAP